ncbi:MAG: hypothetical protein J6S63_08230 [Atopobiaceae bacterium]|nr:hypothetical protein [Atopobiaceae bacterium]
MLTYTFSPREKVMLALLALVGILVAWYQLVFVNFQRQIDALDAEIATVQDEIVMSQSRAAALQSMKSMVEQYKAEGIDPLLLPTYDNTKNLMAYLNGVLLSSTGYSMSFDNPELSEDDGAIHRTGTITFNTDSYESARSIVQAIAHGPYPCQVVGAGITDNSLQGSRTRSSEGLVVTSMQVTFLEEAPEGTTLVTDDGSAGGQDLSALSDWNK